MKRIFKSWAFLFPLACLVVVSGCGDEDSSTTKPSANAGKDITVNKYTPVTLDASSSSNSDSYKWIQTAGPKVDLTDIRTVSPEFTPKSAATYKFTLEAINENGKDSDEVVIVAQDISTVSITSPTADTAISTNQSSLTISGYAGNNITNVSLTNKITSLTYDGSLDGNSSFSIENITLLPGNNLLELIGTDNTGAFSKDTLLVTYNQNVNFLSSPIFSEDAGLINDDVDVVVSIAIEENQNILPDGVKLTELSNDGSIISDDVTTLYDNGNLDNGDDIAGDGVYSSRFTINKSESGIYNYRVVATTDTEEYSSPVYLTILTPITDQEIQSAEEATESAFTNNFPAVGSQFTQHEFDNYKDKILAELLSLADVVDAQLAVDGSSIAIEFNSGLLHTIDFVYADSKSGARSDSSVSKLLTSVQPKISYQPTSLNYTPMIKAVATANASTTKSLNDSIGSYRTFALSPFKWQFDPYDDIDGAYAEIQNSNTPNFTANLPLINDEVTIESFKNLSQYGIVIISSHGGLEGNNAVIYTSEEATAEKQKTYQKDITAKRLTISHKITILVENDELFVFDSQEEKEVFKITPDFITQYNKNMPNTLVYMSICQGASTDNLANAFINAGAGAFVGYTDIVDASYAYNAGQTFFANMIGGKTVEEAVKVATDTHGADDGDFTPAAFVYRGNGDLVLERTGIQNGSFEDNLKYWEQNGGDIRILSKLSSLSPQKGSYMAILSSGLGSINDSEAIITQQFKVPANAASLSFTYDVVSEEPMEFVNSSFDDKFRAVLITENGEEIELAYETINTSTWKAINGSQEDGGMFDGGDETTFHTDWKNIDYQIASLAGQTVTLKFRVWDVGDSIYDTAVLIDNISLQ